MITFATQRPEIDDGLITAIVAHNNDERDVFQEQILNRVGRALLRSGVDRIRYYQLAQEVIPGLPTAEQLFLTWFDGDHGPEIQKGFRIPLENASIYRSMAEHLTDPVQDSGPVCDSPWVQALGLQNRSWFDVLVHHAGKKIGLLSFDWGGHPIREDAKLIHVLQLLGTILGFQLAAAEPEMGYRLQRNLDKLYRDDDSATSLIDDALTALQAEIDVASLSLFRYDWTRDSLESSKVRLHPRLGRAHELEKQESFPRGQHLTGMAWDHLDYRIVRDFRNVRQFRPDLVSGWSDEFHREILTEVESVMYGRLGAKEQLWLIRAINDVGAPRLPFIRKHELLKRYCLSLAPLIDAERAVDRARAVSTIQELIAQDHPAATVIEAAADTLQQFELINRIIVVASTNPNSKSATIPFNWGIQSPLSPDMLARLSIDPVFLAAARSNEAVVIRRQSSGLLGRALGLNAVENADILAVPLSSPAFPGVVAFPMWGHGTERLRRNTLWPDTSREFLSQIVRLISTSIEREESKDLVENALKALSLVGHEMTEPLASAISISRHAMNTMRLASQGGGVVPLARILSWQNRFEPEAESLSTAVTLGELVGRQHGGRVVGVRRRYSVLKLLSEAGDRIDFERLVRRSLLQPEPGLEIQPTEGRIDTHIICDSGLVRAAFTNLLRNAVKYSVSTTVPARIGTAIRRVHEGEQEFVEVDVSNIGLPIPDAHRESIFKAFTRYVDEENEIARRGMGLGLYLVSQIARVHRGHAFLKRHIRVESGASRIPCFESTFTFRVRSDLPLGNYVEEV